MVAGLISGFPTQLNANVDGEHVLTREAPDFWQGVAMLAARSPDLGRDGWKVDTVVDTGYIKTVFLSRESVWLTARVTSSGRRARCTPSRCCCTCCM